ncbi:MAG: integrase [Cyanobacteria bacterium J06638_7]
MRLQVRDGYGKAESITLPYPWEESAAADALLRIRVIYKAYAKGNLSLAAAGWEADASSSRTVFDWPAAVNAFHHLKTVHEGRVGERTWKMKYEPVLHRVLEVMGRSAQPRDAAELCEQVLDRWTAGSRQRQIMRQNLYGFLRFCVDRRKFKACWSPPPLPKEVRKPKRVGYPLSDDQILRLIAGIPDTAVGKRWRFALELLATYGLRPEELRYLVVEQRPEGLGLRCLYRKATGGSEPTAPRSLYPLFVRDADGIPQDWSLVERVACQEELPPLGQPGKGGEALGTFLRRLPSWQLLREEAAAVDEELTPYSFRHRYAKTSHAAKLAPKDIADAMGHTLDTHLQSYAKYTSSGLAAAFAAANSGHTHDCRPVSIKSGSLWAAPPN